MSVTQSTALAGAVQTPEPLSMGEVLRIPVMRRLWIAQLVSTFGDFLALFAVISYLTFRMGATPQQVTGLQIAYLLPIAVLGILAGVFVDRWPLKPTMVSSDLIRAGLCLLLLRAGSLGQFYAVLAAISVVSSFFNPAQGVAIRGAVPLHGQRSAQALMQQVLFGMRIVGPPLAVVLFKLLGPHTCYALDAVSFAASATLIGSAALKRVPSSASPAQAVATSAAAAAARGQAEAEILAAGEPGPEPPLAAGPEPAVSDGGQPAARRSALASILPDMRQGLGFIFGHAGLLFVTLAMAAGMFILGCFGPLIAVYVRDTLHAKSGTYSVASLMIGVGMFAGVNLLNTLGKRLPNTVQVYGGLGGIAAGLLLLAGLPQVWSTFVANLLIGAAVSGIIVPAQTMIQQETPPALMGRVGSSTMSLVFSAQIGGLVLSGILANRIGVRHVFALCAALLLLQILAGRLWMEPRATHANQP